MRARLDAELGPGHGIDVASRGTQARDGQLMDTRMQSLLVQRTGQDTDALLTGSAAHRSGSLTPADVAGADLVLTATRAQRRAVTQLDPRSLPRAYTLRQFATLIAGVHTADLPDEPADRVVALTRTAAGRRGLVPIAEDDHDVPDPFGGPQIGYAEVAAQLSVVVTAVTEALARRPVPVAPVDPPPAADDGGMHPDSGHPPRRRRRRVRRVLSVTATIALLLVLAAGVWTGARGWLAYRHLKQVQAAVPQLRSSLEQGDTDRAVVLVTSMGHDAEAAHRLTSDPVWRTAQHLPVVGRDLRAFSTIAAVGADLSTDALPPVTRLAGLLHTGGSNRSATDLQVLAAQEPGLVAAREALTRADQQLTALPTTGLLGPVRKARATVTAQVAQAEAIATTAAHAAVVLPAMFDATTPKKYLLLFENPAEARSGGGIAGAYAVVTADHGHFSLNRVGAGADLSQFPDPVLNLDQPAYATFFGNRPSTFFLDTTETPWFPDTARFASRMLQVDTGITVDGVIATDPVMLSYLLGASGPVPVAATPGMSAHEITASSAVSFLLNGIYRAVPEPAEQNAAFAATTSAVFTALAEGHGGVQALVRALQRGAGEGRLSVWTRDPSVTSQLSGTTLAGVPAAGTAAQPTVGLYLNDGTASKLSYYLRRSASLSTGALRGGYRPVTLHASLWSTAPTSGLPTYVTGSGDFGIPIGTQRVLAYVVAPTGGGVVSASVDGRPVMLSSAILHGREIGSISVDIAPGARHVIEVQLLAPTGDPRLLLQPLA